MFRQPTPDGRSQPHNLEARLAENSKPLFRAIPELEELLSRTNPPPSREEMLASAALLENILARVEANEKRALRHYTEIEERLLAIENSRFIRLLQLPGRIFGDWKGRLGHLLLHSPLHPLYLKLLKPHAAMKRYRLWVESEGAPVERKLGRQPLISIILPVRNPHRGWLEAAVESVLRQSYGCWQLCVCDDGSDQDWVAEYFNAQSAAEPRIQFVRCREAMGISGASNRAGELARGEYTGFLDQDDVLAPHALYSVAEAVQDEQPTLIYSDEDYLDVQGSRAQPIFKPAFSPDLLFCGMYLGHFLIVRTERLRQLGWLRPEFDGSQDYDLALRLSAQSAVVRHIPRVLYHWRQHPNSTALDAGAKPFTHAAGLKALSEAVARRDAGAVVTSGTFPNTYRVRWPCAAGIKASLVICSRNAVLLKRCLEAVMRRTSYANREVVIVHHRVGDIAAMERLIGSSGCVRADFQGPFDFAAMNNLGARHATGEVLVFINDDVQPLAPEWLEALLAHACRREVGVVGAKLLYRSGAIQHAGITIGILEAAGHLHRNTFGAEFWNWLPFTRNVSAVTGACLAIRKSVFEQLAGFDELFPVNYNDVDLCLRAREAGYEVIIEPAAVLRHYECQSRLAGVRLKERYLFEKRWAAQLERGDPFYSPHLNRTREDAGLELHAVAEPVAWR
jgi:GT2 family glycosyltransferase